MKTNNKVISIVAAVVTGVISFLFFSAIFANWEHFKAGFLSAFN